MATHCGPLIIRRSAPARVDALQIYSPFTYVHDEPMTATDMVIERPKAAADAAGRAPDVTELGAGDIGGMTLTKGVYKWGTGLVVPLSGSATDGWIMQIAQDPTVANGTKVTLSGGALSSRSGRARRACRSGRRCW